MTAPYAPRVAELIKNDLGHRVAAVARTSSGQAVELDVVDVELTFAEDWAPYAQGSLVCAIPPLEELDLLDPRARVRVEISAGYTYPDNITELFPLADLGLRRRPVARPANTMTLAVASDEARAQDYRIQWDPGVPKTGIKEAVAWLAFYAAAPEAATLVSDVGPGHGAAALAELSMDYGQDLWSGMDDAADRVGLRVYCDEARRWRITARPSLAATPSHVVAVGSTGTILSSEADLEREQFYNSAVLRYRWTPAGQPERIIFGRATVASGPLSPAAAGSRVYFEEIPRPVSQATANQVAAAKVRNLVTRGRSLTLEAVAAYWLRPGHTILVELPTGDPELHLVQAVTFRPVQGTMRITTRQPIDVTITTGE